MNLTKLQQRLDDLGILDAIAAVCSNQVECFLVGGAIRDGLLGRDSNDFDFCTPFDPSEHARKIAEILGATWFVLDKERGHSRFVWKKDDRRISCDFAPFRAQSLERDLHKRDFTINAMAISCQPFSLDLIDPLSGHQDLLDAILRACSEHSFQDDPLRCLKGVRHAANLGFRFHADTFTLLREAVPQIDQIASERIRSELAKAVSCREPAKAFKLLQEAGLIRELFGAPGTSQGFENALVILDRFMTALQNLKTGTCGRVVKSYLNEGCEEEVSVETALVFAAFFSGYRPVALRSVLQALRFANRTVNLMTQLQSITPDIWTSFQNVANKQRSRARWLDGTGREPLASAIYMLAVAEPSPENLLQVELLVESYSASLKKGRLAELIDGDWLASEMGISSGPTMGHILNLLHEAEIRGEVTNAEEARQWLRANQNSFDKDFA